MRRFLRAQFLHEVQPLGHANNKSNAEQDPKRKYQYAGSNKTEKATMICARRRRMRDDHRNHEGDRCHEIKRQAAIEVTNGGAKNTFGMCGDKVWPVRKHQKRNGQAQYAGRHSDFMRFQMGGINDSTSNG